MSIEVSLDEELDLIRKDNRQNFKRTIKLIPELFRNPKQANRELDRIERHTLHHIYRAIELDRGVDE